MNKKRPIQRALLLRVAPFFFKLWCWTWRIVAVGNDRLFSKRRVLFVLWHEALMIPFYFLRNRLVVTMASHNTDGEIAAKVGKSLRYQLVRGSSSRGGKRALADFIKMMEKPDSLGALTVDGPRGPRRVVKPGAIVVSEKLEIDLIPIGIFSSKHKILIRSWDQFKLILPFARVAIFFGEPIKLSGNFEEKSLQIQTAIDQAMELAKENLNAS